MWPKDLIVAEARNLGVPVLGLDVQKSALDYRVEKQGAGQLAIRLALPELAGSTAVERRRIAENQPFSSLQDFRDRVRPRRRTFEALARVGTLDSFNGYDRTRRGDLLAHIQGLAGHALPVGPDQLPFDIELPLPDFYRSVTALDLCGRTQTDVELRDLSLAVSHHQMTRFYPLFTEPGITPASELVNLPGGTGVLVAGVRRATHTPPMRSGKRVVFLSLDDGSGPVANVVFFHDAQAHADLKPLGFSPVYPPLKRRAVMGRAWDRYEKEGPVGCRGVP